MRDLMTLRRVRVLGVLALLAAACTSTAEPTTTTSAPTTTTTTTAAPTTTTSAPTTTTTTLPETHGGVAVIGLAAEPLTLNPFFADDPAVQLIAQAWTTGVQDVSGESGELVPEVVVQLPTVANGGVVVNADGTMTVTYEIREEASWADGTPISGRDFQFTLETILDPSLSISKVVYADILSSAVGEKTFGYTLAFPTIEYEHLFGVLIPEHVVAGSDFSTDWNDRTWLSGGPFVLDRWIPGQSIAFARNAQYWKHDLETGQPLPYLDGVTFQIVDDATERFQAVAGQALHAVLSDVDVPTNEQFGVLEALGASIETRPGSVWVHINFQFGPGRWDRNPDSLNEYLVFRQAVMYAVDRRRIAEDLFGDRAVPLDSYVTAYNPAISQGAWSRYSFNPERAVELIAEAVEARRAVEEDAIDDVVVFFTTNAGNDQRARVAELVGEMLSEVGVAYLDTSEDSITFFGETVGSGRYDLGMWAWQAAPGHSALVTFHDVLDPGDPQALTNFYRWGTEDSSVQDEWSRRYGDLLAAMRDSVDHGELTELIQEAEQLAADQALFLPLYAEPVTAVYWPQIIDGFVMNAATGFTWNIEQWQMVDDG